MGTLLLIAVLGLAAYALYTQNLSCGCCAAVSAFPANWLTAPPAPTYVPYINQVESEYGLPTNLLCAVAYQESAFNPDAVNSASGATGMFQLMPADYPNAGQSWQADAVTAAQALVSYQSQFGSWAGALAAYNWGPGNLSQYLSGCCSCLQLPAQTSNYVANVAGAVGISATLPS